MEKETKIGQHLILLPQALLVMFTIMWTISFALVVYIDSSQGALFVTSLGLLLLVGLSILLFKVYAISTENNVIIVRNLFFKKTIGMNKFRGVKTVFFSPVFYLIEVENRGFYFVTDFKSILSFTKSEKEIAIELERKIRGEDLSI